MIEFFQLIASKPLEFLAGLGVSSASIFSIVSILKWIVNIVAKKKKFAKEELKFEKLANLVISKLGGIEDFVDTIATRVINKITPLVNDVKNELTTIANAENCPVELKAYIETVLNAAGNKELLLAYHELKTKLINQVVGCSKEAISKGEQVLEKLEESFEQDVKSMQEEEVKKSEDNENVEVDVTYV